MLEVEVARVLWEVVPEGDTWKVFREGVRVLAKADREACVEYAQRQAQTEWEAFDLPARLSIRRAGGGTERETDFGEDVDVDGH
jgi:hypothetical protein